MKLGMFAAVMVLVGDMLLGWGKCDASVTTMPLLYTRYLSVSDGRIIAAALLGLIGIPIECLSWFAIYRLIKPYSEKEAHLFRGGIIGCLAFGGCGVHVPCCIAVYLLKRFYISDPSGYFAELMNFIKWFLLPATLIFIIFFFMSIIVQYKAFASGHTPYPQWCKVFSLFFGLLWIVVMRLFGDHALTNALATAWISVANLWMLIGLYLMSGKVMK